MNYTSFKELLKRSNKVYGNGNAMFEKELAFIFFFCGNEYYSGHPDTYRTNKIKIKVGLDDKWTVHPHVQDCINDIKEDGESIIQKTVRIIKEQLYCFITVMEGISRENSMALELMNNVDTANETSAQRLLREQSLERMEASMSKVFKYITDLPKALDQIESIETRLRKETSNDKNIGQRKTHKYEKE
jgi:hypothetical protein